MIKFFVAECYTFLATWFFMEGIHNQPIHWIIPVLLSGAIAFSYWYDFITENKNMEKHPDDK